MPARAAGSCSPAAPPSTRPTCRSRRGWTRSTRTWPGIPGSTLNRAELAALSSVLPALEPMRRGARRRAPPPPRRDAVAARGARADAPLVVVLDDLHWADPSSIDLIAALLRRPPAAEVMLALAFRHRQASERLVAAVDRAEREGRTFSVRLAPLDAETASALLGADLPAVHARAAVPGERRQPVLPRAPGAQRALGRRGGRGRARDPARRPARRVRRAGGRAAPRRRARRGPCSTPPR